MSDEELRGAESPRVRTIRFADEYVDLILNGHKTATVRYGWDEIPSSKTTLRMVDESGEPFARASIPILSETTAMNALDAVDMMDATHNKSKPGRLIRSLNRHYEADIGPETEVLVLAFKLKERLRDPTPEDAWRAGRKEARRR